MLVMGMTVCLNRKCCTQLPHSVTHCTQYTLPALCLEMLLLIHSSSIRYDMYLTRYLKPVLLHNTRFVSPSKRQDVYTVHSQYHEAVILSPQSANVIQQPLSLLQ